MFALLVCHLYDSKNKSKAANDQNIDILAVTQEKWVKEIIKTLKKGKPKNKIYKI